MSFKKTIVTVFALAVLGGGISGCEENSAKVEKKHSLIETIVSNANDVSKEYDAKKDKELRKALDACNVDDIDALKNYGITIFIDGRLDSSSVDVDAVYYPSRKILSISFSSTNHSRFHIVEDLAERIQDKNMPAQEPIFNTNCNWSHLSYRDQKYDTWQALFAPPTFQPKPVLFPQPQPQ